MEMQGSYVYEVNRQKEHLRTDARRFISKLRRENAQIH